MVVYVLDRSTGQKHEFDVAGDTTVWKLKGLIEDKTNHSHVDQVLTYRGIRVEPLMTATLAESGIPDGETIDLWIRDFTQADGVFGFQKPLQTVTEKKEDGGVILTIKTLPCERFNLDGQTITIAVKRGALVEDVKLAIQVGRGVPPDEQRLIVSGKQLEDARSIESYGIQSGSVLHMGFSLRGS